MSTPFSISGSLDYPPDDGQPVASRDFSVSNSFDSKEEADYNLASGGPSPQTVCFGTITNAKAFLIEVAADSSPSAAPINVSINGGTDAWEIAPGGFLAYASPSPVSGIQSMEIAYTSAAKVKVRLLG